MSHDALRMRLRRLCEVKPRTKKCHVDAATHEQYNRGGEGREWLEIALTETLEKLGDDKNCHKKLRAPCRQDTPQVDNHPSQQCWSCTWAVWHRTLSHFLTLALRLNSVPELWWSGSAWKARSRRRRAWYTEEKLKKSGEYSAFSGLMIVWTVYSIIFRSIPLMVCFIKYIRWEPFASWVLYQIHDI